jgi:phosphoribosylformylglycinamidine synthase
MDIANNLIVRSNFSQSCDILHLCGLEKIKRIERGIIYHFDRSVTDKKAVLSVIMDKMTESELCSIDEAHRYKFCAD